MLEAMGMPIINQASSIRLDGIRHVFPSGFEALKSTNLDVEGGTFCTLLGASGSGKTTLLRIMAGLISPSHGDIFIGQENVTALPVQERDIGFVFQNYALFPHLTAAQNIEYPLKLRKWDRAARSGRVAEILQMVELSHLGDRKIDELSGGQQQRIAIGRALAYNPRLLLLDEPMGALDRKLRQQLGADLRRIQRQAGITAVYVTHDQEEAFALSDTIVVMKDGEILQVGRPDELYKMPRSFFVSDFLGDANLIEGEVLEIDGGRAVLETGVGKIACRVEIDASVGARLAVCVRPENVEIHATRPVDSPSGSPFETRLWRVSDELFCGSKHKLTLVEPDGHRLFVELGSGADIPAIGDEVFATWKVDAAVLVAR